MATLVLSTVGTILGGPVGGAIGSLLGQSIDQQLLGPGPRQGPRLGDLSVQTSSYGAAIPRLFGKMRVAGNIIWSTDLKEQSQTEGAKGQPDSVTYSYSVSFAVALSSRRISGIGRVWADGKLIRTSDGRFTVGTGFRVYDGSEDQAIDPLIGSIEGIESAPAYRGIAFAVLEDLELAEFGNRIPFLTFEVIADPGPVPVGSVLGEVSQGMIASSAAALLPGYAAYGGSITAAVEPLVTVFGLPLFDDGNVLSSPGPQTLSVDEAETGCSTDQRQVARMERSQLPASGLPSALGLAYYDPDREYQSGLARASFDIDPHSVERLELPAVLQAASAKAAAETCLGRRWAERDTLTLRLAPAYLAVRPGTLISPPGGPQPWRVQRVTLDSLAVIAELRPVYSTIESVPAEPGRVLPSSGVVPAQTAIAILELPDDGTGDADSPVIAIAAAGGAGWHGVPLQVDIAGTPLSFRTASQPTILGAALTALSPGQSVLLDLLNSVDVQLADPADWLESRDDSALAAGANLALLGSELIQFGDALPLGSGAFRLSRLLRGRRGSEWAMASHLAGEQFAMLDPARLRLLPMTGRQAGTVVQVTPGGLADQGRVPVPHIVTGEAMRPPSPVHLRASMDSAGNLNCTWLRRSSLGWNWLDGVDAPLGCRVELYRVALQGSGGSIEIEVESAQAQFSPSQLAAIGGGDVELSIAQVGDFAVSRPALLTITTS